jgi:hypothetical protein
VALLNLPTTLPNGYIPTINEWNTTYFNSINTRVNDVTYDQVSTSLAVDEDNMVSDSATKLPTQQSTKAYVDNSISNLGVTQDDYRIIDGKKDVWGTPAFCASGTANDVNILASAATPLQLWINGTALNITADTNISSFTLATAGVSATISAAIYTGSAFTKTEGEFGDTAIIIDGYASAWTATAILDTTQAFKTGTEFFLAKVSRASSAAGELQLTRATRGIGNSVRSVLSDNAVVYLMQVSWLFIDSTGNFYKTTVEPKYQSTDPAGVAGQFYFNNTSKTWKYYTASWADITAIPLAIVVCDSSTVVAVEHYDFDIAWANTAELDIYPIIEGTSALSAVSGVTAIGLNIQELNVAGNKIKTYNPTELTLSSYLVSSDTYASATRYNLYITPNGEFYFSTTDPREKGKKKGYYHPKYYWRYVWSIYTDLNKQIIVFAKNKSQIHFFTSQLSPASITITSGNVLYEFKFAPIFSNLIYGAQTDSGQSISYTLARTNKENILYVNNNVSPVITPPTELILFNSTIYLKKSAAATAVLYIYGYTLEI